MSRILSRETWQTWTRRRAIERDQWRSLEELVLTQRRRLARLIRYACEHVPYYRRLFDERSLRPEDIDSVEALRLVPLLTKSILQDGAPGDFLASHMPRERLKCQTTSGSTGTPLRVYLARREGWLREAVFGRAYHANGVRPWHRMLFLVPSGQDHQGHPPGVHTLPATLQVTEQVAVLRACRPHVIRGYGGSLQLISRHLVENGIQDVAPGHVFGFAEQLDPPARRLIRSAFGAPLSDLYSCVEAGLIAWECPGAEGYHLNVDRLVVEFEREGRPALAGEPGRVIVTSLDMYAMPIIRYDLGDVATPAAKPCPCGRGLPLMQMIQGRADDFVTLRSGHVVPPIGTFADVIESHPEVREFRVVQESYERVRVQLVVRHRTDDLERHIQAGLETLLRHEAHVDVEIVPEIPRDPGGKLRRITSRVPPR